MTVKPLRWLARIELAATVAVRMHASMKSWVKVWNVMPHASERRVSHRQRQPFREGVFGLGSALFHESGKFCIS